MNPASIDDYLDRLRDELRRNGFEDPRLIDEAREHLADSIEEGLRRGLTSEEAEREAFERFGPPAIVARSTIQERRGVRNRLDALVSTLWRWKWWLIAPTLMMAVGTSIFSFYFLPRLYRSEIVIQMVPPAARANGQARSSSVPEQLREMTESTLTRAQLEQLIRDVGLYQNERAREPLSDVVGRMRRDISILIQEPSDRFVVGFQAPDPRLAMRTTERLASLFIQQNLREARFDYKTLLVRPEEARSAESFERLGGGFQFKVTEPALLPDRPIGPSHLGVNTVGTLAGLGMGVLLVSIRGRTTAAA